VLSDAASDGHVGYPEELALEAAAELTQISPDGIREAIEQLRVTDEIVRDSLAQASGGRQPPVASEESGGSRPPLAGIAQSPRAPSSPQSPAETAMY